MTLTMSGTSGNARSSSAVAYCIEQRQITQMCWNERTNGSGEISTGDSLDRGIEVAKRLRLDDLRTDFGSDTERRETSLNRHKSIQQRQRSSTSEGITRLTGWSS